MYIVYVFLYKIQFPSSNFIIMKTNYENGIQQKSKLAQFFKINFEDSNVKVRKFHIEPSESILTTDFSGESSGMSEFDIAVQQQSIPSGWSLYGFSFKFVEKAKHLLGFSPVSPST